MTKRTQGIHDYLYLFMIHYLLQSKETELFNEWISEKDIPGGTTFFRGPHEIPTKLISLRFNNNINKFKARCEQLSEEIDKIPPQTIYMGYHNDPYQPCEAEYHQTRKVLELFLKKGFSANILTKSDLVFAMLIS